MALVAGIRSGSHILSTQIARASTTIISGRKITFYPAEIVGKGQPLYSRTSLGAEPFLFFLSMGNALERAGPITRYFLEKLLENSDVNQAWTDSKRPDHEVQIVVNADVQHLQKGEYATNPVWYSGLRSFRGETGREWVNVPASEVYYVYFSSASGGVSHKIYLADKVHLILPKEDDGLSVHERISALGKKLSTCTMDDGEIVKVTPFTPIREVPAHLDGLRGMVRIAIYRNEF